MVAIGIRMYCIAFNLNDNLVTSIIAAIFSSALLWGIGYAKDKKIINFIAAMEIILTLIIFSFEIKNIQHNKEKEIVKYNQKKEELIEIKYNKLVKERTDEINRRTIVIPEPKNLINCPTTWNDAKCESLNKKIKDDNIEKYKKEEEHNRQLQYIPYPDKSKIIVYVPYPSNDVLQRVLISLIFNVSIPILYYFLGSLLASNPFHSVMDEAIFRYKNRTDETVNDICKDLGIPVSTFYNALPKDKPVENHVNELEEAGNNLETSGILWKPFGKFWNPLESDWKVLEKVGKPLESLGKNWKLVGNFWRWVGKSENNTNIDEKLDKKAGQDGFS